MIRAASDGIEVSLFLAPCIVMVSILPVIGVDLQWVMACIVIALYFMVAQKMSVPLA